MVQDGEIVSTKPSQVLWTNVKGIEDQEKAVLDQVMPFFTQYYSVKWENYKVHDHFLSNPIRVDVEMEGK